MSTPSQHTKQQQARGPVVAGVVVVAVVSFCVTLLERGSAFAWMSTFFAGAAVLLQVRTRRRVAALALGVLAGAFVWLVAVGVIVGWVGG